MPVATRTGQARNENSPDDLPPQDARADPGEGGDQDRGAGAVPPVAQDSSATPGRAAGAVSAVRRLASRVLGDAEPGSPAATAPSTFSAEQRLELAYLFKQALSESQTALSAVGAESGPAATVPAAESADADAKTTADIARSLPSGEQEMPRADPRSPSGDLDYVPDLGAENPHASAVYTGGDTYLRPQRYGMHRDTTFDQLKSKPNGTLFKAYCTLEPTLRYLFNVKEYLAQLTSDVESGTMSADEFVLHTDRTLNSVSGVYDLLNRHVSLIHLRAQYGDNPTAREKAKLEHVEDVLTEEDYLPASLDDRIRQIARDFDDSYDSAKKNALAKKAANAGGGGGPSRDGDGEPRESKTARAKRLERERKAAAAAKATAADKTK